MRAGEVCEGRVSDPKLKPLRPPPPSLTGTYVPWRITKAEGGESVRWQCVDGRWVAISLGHGAEAGHAIVTSSDGEHQRCDSYEAALELAKRLRTV